MKLSVDGRYRLAAKLAFVAGLGVVSGVSYAQEPPPPSSDSSGDDAQLQTVVVTGSRIKQPQLTAVSPVTAVTAEEIQYQGTTRVEDMLNSMPQVFAGQGANVSNGATGTATVDLRGLGASRTLVLIDGKRMLPGDPANPEPDLNFIPASLIQGIDIATGGASAVYGSDAIAGVVNFKMKRDFQGFQLDVQRSGYWHDNDNKYAQGLNDDAGFDSPSGTTFDGKGWDISAILGFNSDDGKGNATVYATYRQIDPVSEARRDYSNCAFGTDEDADGNPAGYYCGGSSTGYPGRFINDDGASYTVTDGGGIRSWSSSTDLFNYNPYNYFQRNDERYGMGAFAHYQFNDHLDVYSDLMFMSDHTDAVIAPSGAFGVEYTMPCDGSNPLISSEQEAVFCDSSLENPGYVYMLRRNVEGGGRDDDLMHQAYRILLGGRGDIDDVWSYDVYAQYGQASLQEIYRHDFSVTRIGRALDVVDDGSGNAVCASVVDGTDPDCVPWDIWTPGNVTQETLDYLETPGLLTGHTEQQIVSGSVSGSLGQYGIMSPMAVEGVGVAFGAEYRHEATVYDTDTEFSTGDLAGQGGATIGNSGAFQVKELFGEMRVPLVQDVTGIKDLGLELGYRYSDHSVVGSIDTYKIAAFYSPSDDVTVRGGYNRATRAPSILEIAQPTQVALNGTTDPCAGTNPDATQAQCENDPYFSANPSEYGSVLENTAGQYNGLIGVSPGLGAETADTYTLGLVITPTAIRGFSATFDYFNIKVSDLIGGYGQDTILSECYSNGILCDLIHRDDNGSLWLSEDGYVIDYTTNTGWLKTSGVDFSASYKTTLADMGLPDYGTLGIDLVGTYLDNYDSLAFSGAGVIHCGGKYGSICGSPNPKVRSKLRVTYGMPWVGAKVSAQWRYYDSVKVDDDTGVSPRDKKLGSQSYIDLYASYSLSMFDFEVGINNVFDREPPLNGLSLGNGNTFSQVYDALGSYVFGGVSMKF